MERTFLLRALTLGSVSLLSGMPKASEKVAVSWIFWTLVSWAMAMPVAAPKPKVVPVIRAAFFEFINKAVRVTTAIERAMTIEVVVRELTRARPNSGLVENLYKKNTPPITMLAGIMLTIRARRVMPLVSFRFAGRKAWAIRWERGFLRTRPLVLEASLLKRVARVIP